MSQYHDVHSAWERLSRDFHVGMSDAFQIVAAAANTDAGRQALDEILAADHKVAIVSPDALSYLRITRDLPLPPGIDDHRADSYFRARFYTGTRLSVTHRIRNPIEFLYFNFGIVMLYGVFHDPARVRERLQRSGYDPVIVRARGGEKAVGIIMVNEFRDSTFGPYNEVVFITLAVPDDFPAKRKVIDYVNAFSLQTALDQGATAFVLKLWLDELSPIEGGNDYLGTNKDLGSFRFEDMADGTRQFRAWDHELKALVSGTVPRTTTPEAVALAQVAYLEAARNAGTAVPTSTVGTIPVASRADDALDRPATRWAFAVDWRHFVIHAVTPEQVSLRFGESVWGRFFRELQFEPALSFYSPSGVGQILQRVGDSPYHSA